MAQEMSVMDLKKKAIVPKEIKVMPTSISNNALQQFMLNLFETTLLFDVCTDLQYI